MWKNNKSKIMGLFLVFFVGMSSTVNKDKLYEITKNIEIFATVFQKLNTGFVDDIDPSVLMRTGIDAMMHSLDPYTVYYSESQAASYRLANKGKYQGIGAIMGVVDDYVTILEPYADGPAIKAGLKAGDQIIGINGLDTKGKTLEEVDAISLGAPGTKIKLKVNRSGESTPIDITLTREEVNIPNVPYSGMIDENIGYVILTTFTNNAAKNISKAIRTMKREHSLDGLVLDLRHNGGGLLREAIAICNLFIPQGKEVVSTKGKVKEKNKTFKTMGPPLDQDIPIVVLVDKRSASASEIVSGTLQDYDRAVIMGQRSYGKGLVQNFEDVGYNSRIKLTTSKYYIPSGRCIQAVRYQNGEPVDIPDNERSKFKTANGRTVLDGGGITPDVKLPVVKNSEFADFLMDNHIIFKYANEYVLTHDSIESPGDFHFDNYDDFKDFYHKGKYDFVSQAEQTLMDLSKSSDEQVKEKLLEVKQEINKSQQDDLDQYKNEIIRLIELELVTRYYLQSGKAKHKLKGDTEVQKAIDVLKDNMQYKKILGK